MPNLRGQLIQPLCSAAGLLHLSSPLEPRQGKKKVSEILQWLIQLGEMHFSFARPHKPSSPFLRSSEKWFQARAWMAERRGTNTSVTGNQGNSLLLPWKWRGYLGESLRISSCRNMLLWISIRALVVQLESMSDIASSDLFNTVQVLQSWCFKRNSNRIYSGRKDWPGDSPTTRFAFLLVILMEIAILYAWCFFLCHSKCVPLNGSNSTVLLQEAPGWGHSGGVLRPFADGAGSSRSWRMEVQTSAQPI